jgi:hypothetical protein
MTIETKLIMVDRKLLRGEGGENFAVRSFLLYYSGDRAITVLEMRDKMCRSGWDRMWPKWADASNTGLLTKEGAQDWLRHLFSLETLAVRPDLRTFGLKVGYETGSWIDANDPLPDVEAIVDLLLVKSAETL